MAINLTAERDLLWPGLIEVEGEYNSITDESLSLFDKRKATLAVERSVTVAMLPLPYLKGEGAATQFDNLAGQRFIYNMEPFEVSSGFAVTKRAILNNQYKSDFKLQSLNMKEVFLQFKQIQATNIFNNSGTVMTNLGGDGVALLSTAHPYDGGTWANRFTTDLDLNEASLLQALLNMRLNFVDERGIRINAMGEELVVPIQLGPVAERLMHAEGRPGTFSNDPNLFRGGNGGGAGSYGLKKGHCVLPFLTSNYAWWVKSNIPGLIHLEHQPFETSMWVDDVTDNLLVKGYEYYGFFYHNPRCVYGSLPTS